ncbi:MAG: proline--tRNA ligase [Clostridiales bacterium]|nr:proline--tRNA ligase [Clostridiales bacterium]
MKMSQLLGERFKERAFDIASQNLMTRGGYIKQVGNGIYSLFPPAKRIVNKIEAILREEMDALGGQEVLFPVAIPASLWELSGRYTSVGSELVRFSDRSGSPMVLGMTHEEPAVHLAMHVAGTYQKYPFMIYQIQTKFRDEPRARGGLIRVREFTMKDGYSFHTSQEDLEAYYERCYRAYERIFARAGVPEVISVQSDSGMMGGKISHEFMLLADIGEDTLVLCDACGYRANIEAAECITSNETDEVLDPLTLVDTGENKTIEEVCGFLGTDPAKSCKAVVYQRNADDSFVVVFCRGDIDISETKLRNYLKAEIHPAQELESCGLVAGCCGPVNLNAKADVIYDQSLMGATNLVCGANKEGYHYTGFTPSRDVGGAVPYVNVGQAFSGGPCPNCGEPALRISHGIEVGNIFQLGTKYTESMDMTFDDALGNRVHPIMGCYGIGVGRLMASVCEAKHDDYGPIWPISIAPWQVHICALRVDDENVRREADALYIALQAQGIEVLFDDRAVSPGFMFSDADLLGVPIRLVVSPKTLARGAFELVTRDKRVKEDVAIADALSRVRELIAELTAEIEREVPESI